GAAGLGLPDRDYYVKTEPRFQEAREKYLVHVARILELAGAGPGEPKRSADTVFAFGQRPAQAPLGKVPLRDPAPTDHRTALTNRARVAPRFDWAAYFDAAKLPRADLNVQEPKFLETVNALLADAPLPTWKLYLRWQLLHSAAPSLSAPFVGED